MPSFDIADMAVGMLNNRNVKTIRFIFTDGEAITLPYGGERIGDDRVVNGGLHETTEILRWLAEEAQPIIIGGLAWDAVKLGCRRLKLRLSWGEIEEKRQYLSYIAELRVASELEAAPSLIEIATCEQYRDHLGGCGESAWAVYIEYGSPSTIPDPQPSVLTLNRYCNEREDLAG